MRILKIVYFLIFILALKSKAASSYSLSTYSDEGFSKEELQRNILTNFGDPIKDTDYLSERKKIYKEFIHAQSQIQFVLLMRDRIVDIVTAYYNNNHTTETFLFLELIKKTFPENKPLGEQRDFPIFFQATSNGKFQVNGIEKDRIAVNTGSEIYFHVNALARKKNLTPYEVVQLLLHEILHLEPDLDLATKDRWSTDVAKWLESRSTQINLPDGKKFWFLKLLEQNVAPESLIQRHLRGSWGLSTPDSMLAEDLQKSSLVIIQNETETFVEKKFYEAFRTFDDVLDLSYENWDYYGATLRISWPIIRIDTPRLLSNGRIGFNYNQSSLVYEKTVYDGYKKASVPYNSPSSQFRVEFSLQTHSSEVRRTYVEPLPQGSFELNDVTKVAEKTITIISIRIKSENIDRFLNHSYHQPVLLCKDLTNKSQLSFDATKILHLSHNEALLHFEIPDRAIELVQVLIPEITTQGRYKEYILRPLKRETIDGLSQQKEPIAASLEVNDTGYIKLNLNTQKKVVAVIADIQHYLQLLNPKWSQGFHQPFSTSNIPVDELGYRALGRKYKVSGTELVQSPQGNGSLLKFSIPNESIEMMATGPEVTIRHSGFYKTTHRPEAHVLSDTRQREVSNAWVQFADGSVTQVSISGSRGFSVSGKVRSCENLFKNSEAEIAEQVRRLQKSRF